MMGGGRGDEIPTPQEEASSFKRVTRQQSASSLNRTQNPSPNSSTTSKTGSDHQVSAKSGKPSRQARRKKVSPEEERAYEAAYVGEFILSGMVDEMAREQSHILETHLEHTALLAQLEEKMERFLASDNDPGYMKEMDNLLVAAAGVGDVGVKASARVLEITDDKLFRLDIAKSALDNPQKRKGHKANENQETVKKPTKLSIINNSFCLGGSKQRNGTPSKKQSQEANEPDKTMKQAGANGQASVSPVPSSSSSSSSRPKSGKFMYQEPPVVEDTWYRACKFRNSNYTGMCTKLLSVSASKKKKQPSNPERNGEDGSTKSPAHDGASDTDDADDNDDDGEEPPDVPLYCTCESVSYGKMIQCDNDICPLEWFHFNCVGLKKAPKTTWYCPKCRADTYSVKKPKEVLLEQLNLYNKEKENDVA